MSKPTTLLALLLFVVTGAFAAAPAGAASVNQILDDCSGSATGLLQGNYSKADLRKARNTLAGDLSEYTGCYDAITARLSERPRTTGGDGGSDGGTGGNGDGTSGGNGDGTGSGGGTDGGFDSGSATTDGGGGATGDSSTGTGGAATPAPAAPTVQQAGSGEPVQLAGTSIVPGFGDVGDSSSRALPTPLLVFLVLLAAGAVGVAASTIGRRVLARRRD